MAELSSLPSASCSALRIGGVIVFLVGIFPAYLANTKSYSPKSQLPGVVGCLVALFVDIMQNISIISQASTTWPGLMTLASSLTVVALNLEVLGLACISAHMPVISLYLCQVLVFPGVACTWAVWAARRGSVRIIRNHHSVS